MTDKLHEALAPEIVKRRARGDSYRQIAADLDTSRGTIQRALKAAGVLVKEQLMHSTEPETPEPPAGAPSSPSRALDSDPASRPEAPFFYSSLFADFLSQTREALAGEPSKLTRQTVEPLLADLEARSQQALRQLASRLDRAEQDRLDRPGRERARLEETKRKLADAEARLAENRKAFESATTLHGQRVLRKHLARDQDAVDRLRHAVTWRERNLATAEAALDEEAAA